MIRVKRLNSSAILPVKGSSGAAGYDLFTPISFTLEPGQRKAIPLKIAIEIPEHYVGIIKSRSGVALNMKCDVCAGVIDSDYRGEVSVVLHNNDDITAVFTENEKIAQILFVLCFAGDLVETEELSTTVRGSGGFGSTDKREDSPAKRAKLDE